MKLCSLLITLSATVLYGTETPTKIIKSPNVVRALQNLQEVLNKNNCNTHPQAIEDSIQFVAEDDISQEEETYILSYIKDVTNTIEYYSMDHVDHI